MCVISNKRIFVVFIASLLFFASSVRIEKIDLMMEDLEQKTTHYSDKYTEMIPTPIEEPQEENTTPMKFAMQSTGQIIEDQDEFLDGTLTNLTIDAGGYLTLDTGVIDNWKDITTPGPSAREGHAMAYDSKLNKILLFGGTDTGYTFLYDTWVYDLGTNTWTEIDTQDFFPEPRAYHAMVYSPSAEQVLLFGGIDEWEEALNDMWSFDLNTNAWNIVDYNSWPNQIPGRGGHSMIYDPFEEYIWLFGGYDPYYRTYHQDTWLLEWRGDDYAEWHNETRLTSAPSPRAFSSMVCVYSIENPDDRYAILFGGEDDEDAFDDTWRYDFGSDWTILSPSIHPSARSGHSMVYDHIAPRIILFGGYSTDTYETCSDTWIFNISTFSWNQNTPIDHPTGRYRHSMVHIPNSNLSLIFGGVDHSIRPTSYFDDTWSYLGSNYYESGLYLSNMTDYGHIYVIQGNLSWNPPIPPVNTSMDFQIGFSNSTNGESFQFYALETPDFSFTGLAQYIRYRLRYYSDLFQNSTPSIEWVNISYSLEEPTPFIQITSPLNNSMADGSIIISAEADSPNGIANVSFYLDGILQVSLFSTPYSFFWNSKMSENGNIVLTAIATTVLEQMSSHSIQIQINNIVNTTPSSPQNLSATSGIGTITLNWDIPSDDGGSSILQYNVYRKGAISEYLFLGLTTLTSFTDTTVLGGKLYYYVVTAENELGESLFSDEIRISALNEVFPSVPDAPYDLFGIAGQNYVELNWTAPANDGGTPITGYRIYRGINSEEYTLIFISTIPSYNDTLVLGKTTYYYAVTAINNMGESVYSQEVRITPKGISKPQSGALPNILTILSFLVVAVIILRKTRRK
jgi:hypothetical protein